MNENIEYVSDLECLSKNELIRVIQNLHWYFDLKFENVNEILNDTDNYL